MDSLRLKYNDAKAKHTPLALNTQETVILAAVSNSYLNLAPILNLPPGSELFQKIIRKAADAMENSTGVIC